MIANEVVCISCNSAAQMVWAGADGSLLKSPFPVSWNWALEYPKLLEASNIPFLDREEARSIELVCDWSKAVTSQKEESAASS